MSPKARATGGETLDSPLRIEYYPSDDEHSRRKAFTQAFRNPKKLFRDRKPAKKIDSTSTGTRQLSNAGSDSTTSFLAIASDAMSTPNHQGPRDKRLPADQSLRSSLMNSGLLDDDENCSEIDSFIPPKRKQSQDHVEGTARSVSKSRIGTDSTLDTNSIVARIAEDDAINHTPLQAWFEANRHNPYPTREEWEWLASQSGRTIQQISTWFHHQRSRVKALQRGGQMENAVIEWIDGVNADGSPQDTAASKNLIPQTPPSKVRESAHPQVLLLTTSSSAGAKQALYSITWSEIRKTSQRWRAITLAHLQAMAQRARNKLYASEILLLVKETLR
jgi:hypothetical protein